MKHVYLSKKTSNCICGLVKLLNCSQLRTSNLQLLLQNRSDFNKQNCDCWKDIELKRQTGGFEAEISWFFL